MSYQFPGFSIAFIISTGLCFYSAVVLLQRQINPGSFPFAMLMVSLTIWSLASFFEVGGTTIEQKIFWSKWQYVGITPVAPLWLLFSAQYTDRKQALSGSLRWTIWAIPVINLALVLTNEAHHLIYTNVTIQNIGNIIAFYERGILFYFNIIYVYICLFIGTVWLAKDMLQSEKTRRLQSIVFLFSIILAWGGNITYILRLIPIPGLDITPLTISLVALVMAWTISRFKIFDLVPFARNTLFNNMQEGVIVTDTNDIILEINPAAAEIAGIEADTLVGHSVWRAFDQFSEQIEHLRNRTNFKEEIFLPVKGGRIIEIQLTSIEQEQGKESGQLIVLRDVTEQRVFEKSKSDQSSFMEALADTAAVINRSLDLDEVLERILENVIKVVPHESANIAMMIGGGQARFVKVHNAEKYGVEDYLTGLNVDVMSIENFRKIAETKKPVIVSDTQKDGQWNDALENSRWIRSFLGAPIIYQDELLGFINLDTSYPNAFTQAHADRLVMFAEYAATAIANARNYEEIKSLADEFAILYEVSAALNAGVELEETAQAVFGQIKQVVTADLFFLSLYDAAAQSVSFFMYRGNGERVELKPFNLFERPSFTRYVIEKKETVHIPDFKAPDAELNIDQIIHIADLDVRAAVGVPLILRGETVGVLSVVSEKENAYSDHQIQLVETIAQQTAIALENARLFEKMKELAITDELTKVYNRRHFFLTLENEMDRSKRYKNPLSLIMMDIDYFKEINDQYGHVAGDEVLEAVASLSKGLLRNVDMMFRYGGDEFTIMLPETNAELASNVAERIHRTITEAEISTTKGPVRISVSLGVAELDESHANPNHFVESADKALYEAKEAGRNCVRLFKK